MQRKIKQIIFSLLPLIFLFLVAEITVHLLKLDQPSIIAGGSGIGPDSIIQIDTDLGWSLKPNSITDGISINSLGLRSPEIQPKRKNEFRILSLGESTTFGFKVSDSETYSAQLENILSKKFPKKKIMVINAGLSAYSSTQSVKYLKMRGIKLEPDMILFYHEANDYLPSAIRDVYLNEIGVLKTDKQLYNSRLQKISSFMEEYSAFYRFIAYNYAKYIINRLNFEDIKNPVLEIGMPQGRVGAKLIEITNQGKRNAVELETHKIGIRVTEHERIENLKELVSICNKHNITLIIIHPSYKYSNYHQCLLTRFCRENNILMLEAYNSLHPENEDLDNIFMDSWHPTPYGNKLLAEDLAFFIYENIYK